jgi:hypothetical protein
MARETERKPDPDPERQTAPLGAVPRRRARWYRYWELHWEAYWERFRRQQVDDPIEGGAEPYWERFRRQRVDDPVERHRGRLGFLP